MDKVYIEKCFSYDSDEIEKVLRPVIEEIRNETGLFKKGDSLFLKCNLLTDRRPDQFTTTHPEFVRAFIHIMKDYGCQMVLGDSCSGTFNRKVLTHLYEVTGFEKMCREENVELNYDTDSITVGSYRQVKRMHDVDYVIDLCKLKTHSYATYTGAVKNCFGSVPGTVKAVEHALHPSKASFARAIVDICEILKPAVSLMDGIEGMQGNGPGNGYLYKGNMIAVSTNPYALDKMVTDLLSIPGSLLPIDTEARARNLYGSIELISSCERKDLQRDDFNLADSIKKQDAVYPVFNTDKCEGCGKCAASCPQKTITLSEHKAVCNYDNCIRCYCCQEVCPYNAIEF